MIDPQALLSWRFEPVEQRYDARDSTVYALGIGLGADPLDEGQLRFVTVEEDGLLAFPTMAVVLARGLPFSLDPRSGINRGMVLHGEQGIDFLAPLKPSGTVRSRSRITDLVDKGAGKGALIYVETILSDDDGTDIARCRSCTFARADGGFGGNRASPSPPHRIPDRTPDVICDLPTFPNAALLYRLSGDLNPLHSHPAVARAAGFERPILHGLATYGLAAHAVLRSFCGYDPARLKRFDVRFSSPVYPGEEISVEMWRNGADVSFRAHVRARGVKVIDNGLARIE